jgi:hypothetical protein
MGFNTSVLIFNDALETIKNDPLFGKRLVESINSLHCGKTVDVHAVTADYKCSCSAGSVIETHHADGTSVVAFGQNCGQVVTHVYHGEGELPLKILKQLADDLGYTISKKRKKKT